MEQLEKIVNYIVIAGLKAIKSNTKNEKATLDYLAIFAKNQSEFQKLLSQTCQLGKEVDPKNNLTGQTFLLKSPFQTPAGPLKVLKIRRPDPTRPQRGAPDFKVKNYQDFKKKYLVNGHNFSLVIRKDFEMIELKGIDVLVYFPSKTADVRFKKLHLSKRGNRTS